MPNPLLLAEGLTKDYGPCRALDALDLAVPAGETFGLLGPNGSGKSTAIRLALGFLRPSAGRALLAGHDCWADSVNARRHVAYLPGELRGDSRGADVDALAARLEIDLDRPIAHLSSGMKRKVALLQVLVPAAPLLLLD